MENIKRRKREKITGILVLLSSIFMAGFAFVISLVYTAFIKSFIVLGGGEVNILYEIIFNYGFYALSIILFVMSILILVNTSSNKNRFLNVCLVIHTIFTIFILVVSNLSYFYLTIPSIICLISIVVCLCTPKTKPTNELEQAPDSDPNTTPNQN